MRFVHSYWTALQSKNRSIDLICSAYSVTKVHQAGYKIVLYTDDYGKELLKDVPYDEVFVTLNNLQNSINPHIWSASKFISMQQEPLDSIHIDNDVFLYNTKLLKIPKNVKFLAQHRIPNNDDYDFVRRYIKKATVGKVNYPMDWDWKCKDCLHLGSFAFNDQQLKDKIINTYVDLAQQITKHIPNTLFEINLPRFIPNLLLEENFLGMYTKDIPIKFICDWNKLNPCEPNEQYEHFAGGNKMGFLEYIKAQLQKHDIQLYNKIMPQVQALCGQK